MFVLAATAFGFKVLGVVIVGDRTLPPILDRCLALIPAALIAAIVVHDTFSIGHDLGVDGARAAGVGAAVLAAWRKASLILVIVIGAAVAALVRAVT